MTTPDILLAEAVADHNAGRLIEAERGYRRILAVDDQNANAHHLLGLIIAGTGEIGEARGRFRRALALSPDFAAAWYNLGNQLRRRGLIEEAASRLRRAAILDPSQHNRDAAGTALVEAAAARMGGITALNAAFNAIHTRNRADPAWRCDAVRGALGALGRGRLLEEVFEALRLAPANANVVYLAALLVAADGDLESALAVLERPVDPPNPDHARLAAEIAWYLRRSEAARRNYHAFFRARCQGDVPLRPLLAEVAQAPAFQSRPRPPASRPVLIYAHYGNPDYLHFSIGQNLIANPGARIFLIGDRENRIEGVEHRRLDAHAAAAHEMVGLYRHDSGNAYCYELFCIARWFMFLDLCRREGLDEVFILDSDYMLFSDLQTERARIVEHGVAFSFNSAHFSYFTVDRLAEFCAHILAVFHSGEDTGSFHARNHSQLFSDMAFIYDYQRHHPHTNLCQVRDDTFFDYSITDGDGFRGHDGIKDVWFEDGRAYGFHEASGRAVRFHGLHFQGFSKARMRDAFHKRSWARPEGHGT